MLQVIKICCSKIIIDVIIEYISKITYNANRSTFRKHCHPNSRGNSKVKKSIYIAVAWFTNRNTLRGWLSKPRRLYDSYHTSNDDINNNSSIDFEQLHKLMGKFIK
jgi:hypothetical protein